LRVTKDQKKFYIFGVIKGTFDKIQFKKNKL
jgi:hypothetical protein